MSVELSEETKKRLQILYHGEDLELATDLLTTECADKIPLWGDVSPVGLERIRYAAMKLGDGDLGQLDEAVKLAQIDWRDALVMADFGKDPGAHMEWWPKTTDSEHLHQDS